MAAEDITVLTFNGQSLRSIEVNGERMYAPVDVYRCLGHRDPVGSAKYLLREFTQVRSVRAEAWPYQGPKPRVIDATGVLELLGSIRGTNRGTAKAFRDWFQATTHKPIVMADIADRLDPETRAYLRRAFVEMTRLAEKMSDMLDARTALNRAHTQSPAVQ